MPPKSCTASRMTSSLDSALKNLDLTLELEMPLGPQGSCSSSPDISLGPVKIQSGTLTLPGVTSEPICIDTSAIGNWRSRPTTGDQLP